ncbi:myo-inosose-2 dehydratase [Marinomonas posidonica]|uniref:Myo-inosose-2 dehydratase n=1 Tax=Marinomonas posidonica (strain CECT 7376 / NCIMB 14433 / IVIA-Po-181) TaxID=491952 RepID=F6CU98_MARPP|nr:myo-inosose-2 dehydratase [Marinomonas posidonica]AEF55217.1 Myo-inosose-2 dehydratase [Marinomonas posidonica IVIA-Po-181]
MNKNNNAVTASKVRIGINPLTWTNDDLPSLGADTPLEVCLTEARQAGYSGVELGNKFPRDPAVLGPILKEHDLDLVSGWYSARLMKRSAEEEIAAMQDHLTLLKTLGAKVMVFAEVTNCIHGDQSVPLSQRPGMTEAQWAEYAQRITQVADYMAEQGVKLAYHHHMGTVIETAEEVDKLMAMTSDNVGLLLDTGHITFAGGNPLEMAKKHAKRIVHVHCKDVRPTILRENLNRDSAFLNAVLDGVYTVPGDGCIDYTPIFDVLNAVNYQGWIVVEAEQDPAIAHPLTYATMGYQYLSSHLEQVGFKI